MSNNNTYCFYHSETVTTSSCERCNRPVCSNCLYSFENFTRHFYDGNEAKNIDWEAEDYRDILKEELHWCHPCYFDFSNQKMLKKAKISRRLTSIFGDVISSIFVSLFTLLFIGLNLEFFNIYLKVDNNSIIAGFIVFCITMFGLHYYNKRLLIKEKNEFDEFKYTYFNELNLEMVDFPITCYYCGEELRSDSFTCLNINCTLGEKIDENAKVITLEPRNDSLFETLSPLPKDPHDVNEKS